MEVQKHTTLRRPSTDLPVLVDQLQRELETLERDGERAPEPYLYRAYLHYAYNLAWEGVSRGDLEAPRRVLDRLLEAQPFADNWRPEDLDPVREAALELDFTLQALYRACDAVADRQVEVRLEQRQSESDRQVLKVLARNQDRYMRRVEVHEQMDPETRPTLVRIGQILAELHEDGLLKRVFQRAQGSAQASFYALAPRGVEVCRKLWSADVNAEIPLLNLGMDSPGDRQESPETSSSVPGTVIQALSSLVDPALPWNWRRVLAGAIANFDLKGSIESLPAQLQLWLGRSDLDSETEVLIRSILTTWTFRLVSSEGEGESKKLSELIETMKRLLKPSSFKVFRLEGDKYESLLTDEAIVPGDDLIESVQKAREDRRSTFRCGDNDRYTWALFDGEDVSLALEVVSSVELSPGLVADTLPPELRVRV